MSTATMHDLELETAELLPPRETLWVPRMVTRPYPWLPVRTYPGDPGHFPLAMTNA
jgi:hypothetical protein